MSEGYIYAYVFIWAIEHCSMNNIFFIWQKKNENVVFSRNCVEWVDCMVWYCNTVYWIDGDALWWYGMIMKRKPYQRKKNAGWPLRRHFDRHLRCQNNRWRLLPQITAYFTFNQPIHVLYSQLPPYIHYIFFLLTFPLTASTFAQQYNHFYTYLISPLNRKNWIWRTAMSRGCIHHEKRIYIMMTSHHRLVAIFLANPGPCFQATHGNGLASWWIPMYRPRFLPWYVLSLTHHHSTAMMMTTL